MLASTEDLPIHFKMEMVLLCKREYPRAVGDDFTTSDKLRAVEIKAIGNRDFNQSFCVYRTIVAHFFSLLSFIFCSRLDSTGIFKNEQ